MKIDYADAILKLRFKLNLSQQELAKLLNVSFPSISRWENGHHEPTKLAKIRILELLKENNIEVKEVA
ncbi:MAG: helix-turn-helix transcriptional regulator [Erysipelotrichales bacterium]|nr:helix-turn-helix transcriptional regulator [Erysipelotrichales bacterium]